jgi:hypothetical protein
MSVAFAASLSQTYCKGIKQFVVGRVFFLQTGSAMVSYPLYSEDIHTKME